jgi:hypothetical protein
VSDRRAWFGLALSFLSEGFPPGLGELWAQLLDPRLGVH